MWGLLKAALLVIVLPISIETEGKASEAETVKAEFEHIQVSHGESIRRLAPIAQGRCTSFVHLTRCWMLAAQHDGYLPHAAGHRLRSGDLAPLTS